MGFMLEYRFFPFPFFCLIKSHKLTRSRAVALNFWSKNALGSIWPGGFPIPNERMLIFSKWKKFIWRSGRTLRMDLGFQTNQFLAEEILCSLENDKSRSSTCYSKMSKIRCKITQDNPCSQHNPTLFIDKHKVNKYS